MDDKNSLFIYHEVKFLGAQSSSHRSAKLPSKRLVADENGQLDTFQIVCSLPLKLNDIQVHSNDRMHRRLCCSTRLLIHGLQTVSTLRDKQQWSFHSAIYSSAADLPILTLITTVSLCSGNPCATVRNKVKQAILKRISNSHPRIWSLAHPLARPPRKASQP